MWYRLWALVVLAGVVGGCSDVPVDTGMSTVNQPTSWTLPSDAPQYDGPTWADKYTGTVAGKPLTTITFDELPFQPVHGLSYNGVSYEFFIGGSPSSDARYNAFGPSPGPFIDPPVLEGDTRGALVITFDQPTDEVAFGFVMSTFGSRTAAAKVEVYGPNEKLRGEYVLDTTPSPVFTGAEFSYSKNAVKYIVVMFDSRIAGRFALDNLTFHQGD